MATETLTITGMHCSSCGMLIDESLEELAGVRSSRTNVRKGKTVVDYDDDRLGAKQLIKAVTKLGYQAAVKI